MYKDWNINEKYKVAFKDWNIHKLEMPLWTNKSDISIYISIRN